jgi:type I restriction enzyme S subunit
MTDWPRVTLETIAVDLQPGFAYQPTDDSSRIPQLRTNNVSPQGGIDLSETKRVPANNAWIARYSLKPGDLLFNNTNSPALVGKTAVFDEDGLFLFSNHMTRIRLATDIAEPRYVAHHLHWV